MRIRRSVAGSNRQILDMSTMKVDSSPGRAFRGLHAQPRRRLHPTQQHDGYLVGIDHRFRQGIQACAVERDGHLGHQG